MEIPRFEMERAAPSAREDIAYRGIAAEAYSAESTSPIARNEAVPAESLHFAYAHVFGRHAYLNLATHDPAKNHANMHTYQN